MEHYPKGRMHPCLVFLTLRGDEQVRPNLPFWIPLALSDCLARLTKLLEAVGDGLTKQSACIKITQR